MGPGGEDGPDVELGSSDVDELGVGVVELAGSSMSRPTQYL